MRTGRIIFGPQLTRSSEVRTPDVRPTEGFLYLEDVISIKTELFDLIPQWQFLKL